MSTFIPFTSDAEVISIGRGLVDCTLPKTKWTHAAHFAAALWLIETDRSSTVEAVIRAYNESVGVANTETSGYHETITQASMRAAGVLFGLRGETYRCFSRLQRPDGVFSRSLRLVADLLVARSPLLHRRSQTMGRAGPSPLDVPVKRGFR